MARPLCERLHLKTAMHWLDFFRTRESLAKSTEHLHSDSPKGHCATRVAYAGSTRLDYVQILQKRGQLQVLRFYFQKTAHSGGRMANPCTIHHRTYSLRRLKHDFSD